jgi:hypothetical protein
MLSKYILHCSMPQDAISVKNGVTGAGLSDGNAKWMLE